jgi:hypothetical protein
MAADEHPKRVWQANGTSEEKGIPTNSAPVAYHPPTPYYCCCPINETDMSERDINQEVVFIQSDPSKSRNAAIITYDLVGQKNRAERNRHDNRAQQLYGDCCRNATRSTTRHRHNPCRRSLLFVGGNSFGCHVRRSFCCCLCCFHVPSFCRSVLVTSYISVRRSINFQRCGLRSQNAIVKSLGSWRKMFN